VRTVSDLSLRELLSRDGSYPTIAAAVASGRLPAFDVALFDHVGDVYRRVEIAVGPDVERAAELRLTALVHEESPDALPRLLRAAGVADLSPTVLAVTRGFGRIWKIEREDDLRSFVEAARPFLGEILLFELAHEGRPIPQMERAAEIGRIRVAFARWAERLARDTRLSSSPRTAGPQGTSAEEIDACE
jgi:hypothetical protein